MKNSVYKGSVFVALGAASYGMLASFVKLAYREGYDTAQVTLSQYSLGVVGLLILSLLRKRESPAAIPIAGGRSIARLIFAGTSLGLTSITYYKAVQYIPASVAIVLLMQAAWMGTILEAILRRKAPAWRRVISIFVILAGTVLATDLVNQSASVNWPGLGWGMLAAICYTATMYSSNHIELHFPPLKRSLYMMIGGLIVTACIFHSSLHRGFSYRIFLSWGLLLSFFGTILPPLLFTMGMPLTGIGLGAIVASIEIPVTLITAHLLINEPVSLLQWLGVVLILVAVVLMNLKQINSSRMAATDLHRKSNHIIK